MKVMKISLHIFFSHLGEPIQINLYSVSNEVIDDNLETTENLSDVFSSNK